MTTLKNTFHNTEVKTKLTPEKIAEIKSTHPNHWSSAEKQAVKRIWTKLCGINGCTCGDIFGVRL